MRQDHQVNLGMVLRQPTARCSAAASSCPCRGGATISPRWPLPIGGPQIHDPRRDAVGASSRRDPFPAGKAGVRFSKNSFVARLIGRFEVDRLDLDQRENTVRLPSAGRICPDTVSPVCKVELAGFCDGET